MPIKELGYRNEFALYVCDTYCFVALLASFPRDWVKEQKISDVACIPYAYVHIHKSSQT